MLTAPSSVIIKLTARCNLKCDYCYVFEHADRSFLHKPAVMPWAIFKTLIDELRSSAQAYGWKQLRLTLHGGEPLLAGKAYIDEALSYARAQLGFLDRLGFVLQTNGALLDPEWIALCVKHDVCVGVSLDGPPSANDLHRVDHRGRSTHAATERGVQLCRAAQQQQGLNFGGVLAVIDPQISGKDVFAYFVDELSVTEMDFLLPDATHDDCGDYHLYPPLSYAQYLIEVFDAWWKRRNPTLYVRFLNSIMDALLGGETATHTIGGGASHLLVVETDGSLEPLDVLRIIQDGYTRQDMFIGRTPLAEFFQSPLIQHLREAGNTRPIPCQRCRYQSACGGGYLPNRYSRHGGFHHPSLYCPDLKAIIEHVWQHVQAEVTTTATMTPTVTRAAVAGV